MTNTPTPAEIETLREAVGGCGGSSYTQAIAILDRLSPAPEPDVDEATKIWREMRARGLEVGESTLWAARVRAGKPIEVCEKMFCAELSYLRQVIAELIASKDGEIERLAGINSQLVAEHNAMNQDGARLESELATLQAENERLIATYVKYVAFDQPEAAERNPAERKCYSCGGCGYVMRLVGSGVSQQVQCDFCNPAEPQTDSTSTGLVEKPHASPVDVPNALADHLRQQEQTDAD